MAVRVTCPNNSQFTYTSLASTTLFLFHTMLFFWNRYELPALHAGLITPQSPRMTRLAMDRDRIGGEVNGIASPPRIQPSSRSMPHTMHHQEPPPIPQISSLDDRSTHDFTPQSSQQSLLPPMRSYVAVASSSLQSIRSLASIQSLTSLAAADRSSPNFIFQGGYGFNDSPGEGDDSEEDSYIARVTSS